MNPSDIELTTGQDVHNVVRLMKANNPIRGTSVRLAVEKRHFSDNGDFPALREAIKANHIVTQIVLETSTPEMATKLASLVEEAIQVNAFITQFIICCGGKVWSPWRKTFMERNVKMAEPMPQGKPPPAFRTFDLRKQRWSVGAGSHMFRVDDVNPLIARGGNGVVQRAFLQTSIDGPLELVAAKTHHAICSPEVYQPTEEEYKHLYEELMKEVAVLQRLNASSHENVVAFKGVAYTEVVVGGKDIAFPAYICMELLETTLHRRIHELRDSNLAQDVRGLVAGLDFIHSHGVMHRDLKPRNILVSAAGVLKFADAGSAKIWQQDVKNTQVGTPAYTAPEIQGTDSAYDYSVDIFSLGITVMEIILGEEPCPGARRAEQIEKAKEVAVLYAWLLEATTLEDPKARPTSCGLKLALEVECSCTGPYGVDDVADVFGCGNEAVVGSSTQERGHVSGIRERFERQGPRSEGGNSQDAGEAPQHRVSLIRNELEFALRSPQAPKNDPPAESTEVGLGWSTALYIGFVAVGVATTVTSMQKMFF